MTKFLIWTSVGLSLLFIIVGAALFTQIKPNNPGNVLGSQSKPPKTAFVIAVYGDSFVDTMGENLEYLQGSLKRRYPSYTFTFYNYGIGSQNAQQGVERFDSAFNYKTRHYPPITELHPDIIIMGSFAYNPFSPYDRNKHWNTLTLLVQKAQATGASVYMLAEIAPLKQGFGKGPGGVNWPDSQANLWSQHIAEQLQNAVYLAKDHLHVPLIDAYDASTTDGTFGNPKYVNKNDGIHPSELGHQFMADLIARSLKFN